MARVSPVKSRITLGLLVLGVPFVEIIRSVIFMEHFILFRLMWRWVQGPSWGTQRERTRTEEDIGVFQGVVHLHIHIWDMSVCLFLGGGWDKNEERKRNPQSLGEHRKLHTKSTQGLWS